VGSERRRSSECAATGETRRKRSFTSSAVELIPRIVVGVLYMEHGLAKILDFPHQPNHTLYAPFTLNPGLRGLLELVGGLLLALGLFTRPLPFVLAGDMGGRLFHGARAERCLPAAQRGELAIVHSFVLPLFLGRRGRRMEP